MSINVPVVALLAIRHTLKETVSMYDKDAEHGYKHSIIRRDKAAALVALLDILMEPQED
jgi:hypothetical protein